MAVLLQLGLDGQEVEAEKAAYSILNLKHELHDAEEGAETSSAAVLPLSYSWVVMMRLSLCPAFS